ncbi:hypothetical protein ACF07T_18535 [Streptomyces sp. NPDC015184]|uniref:hypothetical protein n=1 Tax=Streptomyces sp. NPDC015184 TaxID=3364946 RepID=UPI0036FB8EB9
MSIIRRSLPTVAGVVAVLGLFVTSASATSVDSWTVSNPRPDGAFSGVLKDGTRAMVEDVSTGQQLVCYGPETRVKGSMPSGVYPDGTDLGAVTDFAWGDPVSGSCHGPLGTTFSAELISTGMKFNAESYTEGIVAGRLTGVVLAFAADTWTGHCTMRISGSLDHVTYRNSTSELSITGGAGLTMSEVSTDGSCMGLLNEGDRVEYSATFVLDEPLTVSSP